MRQTVGGAHRVVTRYFTSAFRMVLAWNLV
jgi:hypothetical protein